MKLTLLLADHFESLASGKILGLGLFPDRVVLVDPAPPGQRLGIDLCVLCCLTELPAHPADVLVELVAPGEDKAQAGLTLPNVAIPAGRSCNIISKYAPLLVGTGGMYTVRVEMAGQQVSDQFEVRVRPVPLQLAAPDQLSAAKAPSSTKAGSKRPRKS